MSIHDEVDLVVDRHLMEALSYPLAKEAECKNIYDRFGFRYVNIYFDMEYNNNGSFAVNSGFDVYQYRAKEIGLRLQSGSLKSEVKVPHSSSGKIIVYLKVVDEAKLAELSKLGDGECRLFLDVSGECYEYDRKVVLDKVVLGKFVYNFISD
jgi:hypothetical protein